MKSLILSALALGASFASVASATEVVDARVDERRGVLEIDVRYGGGCKEHEFKLDIGACMETMPVQCEARIRDLTEGDFCEAIIGRRVVFSLKELGLDEPYYRGGSLKITGSRGSKVVTLPR